MRVRSRRDRRGITTVQTALLIVLIASVSVGSYLVLGTTTRASLNTTATNAGDPNSLVSRFSTSH